MVASRYAESLTARVERFLLARQIPSSGLSRLCVAFSGGVDSVVLLHALHRLKRPWQLSAVHVHHGLSINADYWADFCTAVCREYAVPLQIARVQVPLDSGEGVEAAARRLRYAVFADCPADWLALAQHRDDQAETVLLNLLRGAGVAGTAGMPVERKIAQGAVLIRPLLDVSRSEIEAYARTHGLRWIVDESNDDPRYRRNFLRHDILPRLESHFPAARVALTRAAAHFAEAADLLETLAQIDRETLSTPSGRIAREGFRALPVARARNLLRYLWREAGFRAPDARWIDEARKQLAADAASPEICLETADGQLRVYRGELYFVRHLSPLPEPALRWQGEAYLPWGSGRVRFIALEGQGIRRSLMETGAVQLRQRQGGERLQLSPHRPRRSLKKLLQEAAIPPWERDRLPCLWCNEQLLWVGPLGVDAAVFCTPGEAGILPVLEICAEIRLQPAW